MREARLTSPLTPPFAFVEKWLGVEDGALKTNRPRSTAEEPFDPEWRSPPGALWFERLRHGLVRLAQGRTVLLVLTDLHLADPDGLALVARLAARLRQLSARRGASVSHRFGLLLTRTADETAAPDEAFRPDCIEDLLLEPTDTAAMADAMAQHLQSVDVGDPSALGAQIRTLMQRPGGLEGLVLAGLGAVERELIELVALLRRPTTTQELLRLSQAAEAPVHAAVTALLETGGLTARGEALSLGPLVGRPTLVRSLSETRRIELHHRIGETLGSTRIGSDAAPTARSAARAEELAWHLLAAGAPAAPPEAQAAARALNEVGAARRALRLLAQLVESAPEQAEEPEVMALQAAALESLEQWHAALPLRRAVAEAHDGTDSEREAALALGKLLLRCGEWTAAAELFETTRNRLSAHDSAMRARMAAGLVEACLQNGELRRAERIARATLAESGLLDDSAGLTEVGPTLGKTLLRVGRDDEAREVLERVLEAAERARRPDAEARARYNLGVLALYRGALRESREQLKKSLELSRDNDDYLGAGLASNNLAVLYSEHNRIGDALAAAEAAVVAFEELGESERAATALAALSALLLSVGDTVAARRAGERALSAAEESAAPALVVHCLRRAAEVALAERRFASAEAGFRRALGEAERLASLPALSEVTALELASDRCWTLLGLAETALQRGEAGNAHALVEDLLARPKSLDEEQLALALALRARLLLRHGPSKRTLFEVNEALEALERAGRPVEIAEMLVRKALVQLAAGEPEHALELAAESEALLAEMSESLPRELAQSFRAHPQVARTLARINRVRAPGADVPDREQNKNAAPVPALQGEHETSGDAESERARRDSFPEVRGTSRAMRRVLRMVERMAAVDTTVLLLGESGTGKELLARALVRLGPRRDGPFVRINAAALSDSLLQSELFGHERGAFTGAERQRKGAFESAHGGCLFLDEIGDISATTQVSLLRVLQEREVQRIGGNRPVAVDVRVICATNRDLDELVAEGLFRLDLYHRIRGLTIHIPPLRDRPEDIAPLAEHLLATLSAEVGRPLALDESALALLRAQPWPGNVRELENQLRTVAVLSSGEMLTAADFLSHTDLAPPSTPPRDHLSTTGSGEGPWPARVGKGFSLAEAKRELERACIRRALAQTGGNITKAAPLLGMKRARLSQRIKELG